MNYSQIFEDCVISVIRAIPFKKFPHCCKIRVQIIPYFSILMPVLFCSFLQSLGVIKLIPDTNVWNGWSELQVDFATITWAANAHIVPTKQIVANPN